MTTEVHLLDCSCGKCQLTSRLDHDTAVIFRAVPPEPAYAAHVTERCTIQRLEVMGPMGERGAVLEALYADGFDVKRSGPYTDDEMSPKIDPTRFLITAERIVE